VGPLTPWASAGKTGTTDGPYDTWFVGYTAQRSTAVWVGDPGSVVNGTVQRRQLTNIDVAGTHYGTVFGASIAAPIWKDLMSMAMRGLPAEPLSVQAIAVQPQPTQSVPLPATPTPTTTTLPQPTTPVPGPGPGPTTPAPQPTPTPAAPAIGRPRGTPVATAAPTPTSSA
jgi:membrane peptidoglycan carboxypeptidase